MKHKKELEKYYRKETDRQNLPIREDYVVQSFKLLMHDYYQTKYEYLENYNLREFNESEKVNGLKLIIKICLEEDKGLRHLFGGY